MIQINECNEPLVEILSACPDVVIKMQPFRQKTENTLFLRSTVASMLQVAQKLLPSDITFVVMDAWRPMSVQKAYFARYYNKFRHENVEWTDNEVYRHAAKYAIPPDQMRRAGHMTGAAVDLSLWREDRRLPMKNKALPFEERARTDADQLSDEINKNRRILRTAMERAGFINYPNEFWHFSYGDTMWAEITGQKSAQYGPIESL